LKELLVSCQTYYRPAGFGWGKKVSATLAFLVSGVAVVVQFLGKWPKVLLLLPLFTLTLLYYFSFFFFFFFFFFFDRYLVPLCLSTSLPATPVKLYNIGSFVFVLSTSFV